VPTELLLALYRGDTAAVEELRASGGELDVFEAAALGELDTLGRILADDAAQARAWSDDGFTALHYAAFFGHARVAQLLIDAGADLEAPSRNEEFALDARPLHSASAGRHDEVCRVLLEAGADPNATQHGGFTPLRQAEQNGDSELVALLREYGASR
jgi:ankyrin repeat protein